MRETHPDGLLLAVLDLHDNTGLSFAEVAARLGLTRASVAGMIRRIRTEEAKGIAGDGTLPRRWWQGGIEKRQRAP